MITTNGTYHWSFMTEIGLFRNGHGGDHKTFEVILLNDMKTSIFNLVVTTYAHVRSWPMIGKSHNSNYLGESHTQVLNRL